MAIGAKLAEPKTTDQENFLKGFLLQQGSEVNYSSNAHMHGFK